MSTRRSISQESLGFTTLHGLDIPPSASRTVLTVSADGDTADRTGVLGLGDGFPAFSATPVVDDALYLGLDQPARSSLLLVQAVCSLGGYGIDPRRPPLVWEAWTPSGWEPCEVERDDTLGLNVSGAIELHVPDGHDESVVGGIEAAWIRCRVVQGRPAVPLVPAAGVRHGRDDRRRRRGDERRAGPRRGARHVRRHRGPGPAPRLPPDRPGPRGPAGARGGRAARRTASARRRGRSGRPSTTSGPARRRTGTSRWTRPPGRSGSGRPCAWRTAPSGGSARSPPGVPRCGCAATGPAAAPAGTSPPGRSRCSARRSPTSPRSTTAAPPRAGWTARTSTTPGRAGRWSCAVEDAR